MARKQYPAIGYKSKGGGKKGAKCAICKNSPGISRIDIEVNWFRGDDDVFYVCLDCYRLKPAEILAGLGYGGSNE